MKISNARLRISRKILGVIGLMLLAVSFSRTSRYFQASDYFLYQSDHLKLTSSKIVDSLRNTDINDLPDKKPNSDRVLTQVSPLTQKLWKIALADVESNMVETSKGRYFGAGKKFGVFVYTRDISYSGLLALNKLYPEEMLSSLRVTRDVRLSLGLKVSQGYAIPEISADWQEEKNLSEKQFIRKYKTNSYTRRTDDVIWLWAARDLFEKNQDMADWQWLYSKGIQSFESLYWPFYDNQDGLFHGQSSFVDIHFQEVKATGYPQDFSMADCVLVKALSTNCLYYQGMLSMAIACDHLQKTEEKDLWLEKAEKLKQAIRTGLSLGNGRFSYFKDKIGKLQSRRDALGSALVVLSGIVEGNEARECLSDYPESWAGIPIFDPFFPHETVYHNNTAWPFVDTFFLWAKEKAYREDFSSYNAALLARTCFEGKTFRELVNYNTKIPYRSDSQLWTASSFLNVCLRKSGQL